MPSDLHWNVANTETVTSDPFPDNTPIVLGFFKKLAKEFEGSFLEVMVFGQPKCWGFGY